ncbi:MAG: hypothetical protein ABSG15_02445 [FCB group bacterium]|jgi:hypothetical protein
MKKLLLIIVCILILTSCGLFDNGTKKIIGGYSLVYIDLPDVEIWLNYKDISILEPCVSEVGFNENFIIALQHPVIGGTENINIDISDFYIIPITNKINNDPTYNIIGPLKKDEFLKKRKELKVPDDLKFTLFPRNPSFWSWF